MNVKEFLGLQFFLIKPSHTQQNNINQFLSDFGLSNITEIESGLVKHHLYYNCELLIFLGLYRQMPYFIYIGNTEIKNL